MTPKQIRAAVDALPLTQAQIAEEIGISKSHLRNTLSTGRPLGRPRSDGKATAPEKLLLLLLQEHDLTLDD